MMYAYRPYDTLRMLFLIYIKPEQRSLYCHVILKQEHLSLELAGIKIRHPVRLKFFKQFFIPHIKIQHRICLIRLYYF